MKSVLCIVILIVVGAFAASPEVAENKKQTNQIVIQKPFQEPQYYYKPISYIPQYFNPEQYHNAQYYTYRAPVYTPTGPIYTQPIVKSPYTYPFYSFPSVAPSAPFVSYDYKPPTTIESN